jgi:serine/threonine protein kinase
MVARFNTCDKRRLRQVLAAGAGNEIEADVAGHLERCESCRQELELLAGGAEWWSDARSYLTPPDAEISGDSARGGTTRRADDSAGGHNSHFFAGLRKQLGFLSPTETAESLGRLGPYEITDVIGRGGMGIVLEAHDPALNRKVAIKVLAAEWAHNATARRRFAWEAKAAAAVVHDHVVPIYSVDANGDVPFLVMAHIPGRSLQQRIDATGPLEIKEILRIGMQTAAGLAAAHAQGLVHRDIKPANILLENSVERVRITDFGLARAVDDVSQTQSGILAGTPQYMSPEQASGEAVDHRTDLFSLGSVLYAMCTGRSPFRAETTVAVIRRICDGHCRAVREVNPDVPEWLAEIIEKLHEKDPANRFQTAAEVADLLERHLAHLQQPTVVPQPGRLTKPEQGTAPLRRPDRRWVFLAGGIALTLAIVSAASIRNFLLQTDSGRPDPAGNDQSQQASDTGSRPSSTVAGAAPIDALPAGNSSMRGAGIPSAENLAIEADIRQLHSELQRIAPFFFPREAEFRVSERSPEMIDVEQRLDRLEEELRANPFSERNKK